MKSLTNLVFRTWPFNKILALDSEIEALVEKQKEERKEVDRKLKQISAATLEGDWGSIVSPRET
jgi:hypothetical protein